jgi:acylphosphatase
MSDHKGELVLIRNGERVPGEVRNLNDRIRDVLIKASTREEQLLEEMAAAVQERHHKMQLAIDRIKNLNTDLTETLAEQVSEPE